MMTKEELLKIVSIDTLMELYQKYQALAGQYPNKFHMQRILRMYILTGKPNKIKLVENYLLVKDNQVIQEYLLIKRRSLKNTI